MKYKLLIILISIAFLGGCYEKKSEMKFVSDVRDPIQTSYNPVATANTVVTATERQGAESTQVTKISWKAVDYGADFFHLYVTLNGETDYYVGYFFGENFSPEPNAELWNADVPENALAYFRGMWTGAGEWFYMYRKSDTELAIMNHPFAYGVDWDKQSAYKEILVIPLEKGSQIQIEYPVIIREMYDWGHIASEPIVYDSFVLGGTERWSKWIPNDELKFETDLSGDMGYRLFENGEYLDTVSVPYEGFLGKSVNVKYNGERFQGLAINNILPLRFGEKILLDKSAKDYQDYVAQILADNGLEGESVNISEIIKTDLEGDGVDEDLIIASNIRSENRVKGYYSIAVLRKIIDGNAQSIFLVKDIKTNLQTALSDNILYEYKLCEIVDLNYDDVCELLLKRENYSVYCYQVYEFKDNEFKIVLSNGCEN